MTRQENVKPRQARRTAGSNTASVADTSIAEVLAQANDNLILDRPPDTRLVCEACGKDYPHIQAARVEVKQDEDSKIS